MSEQGSAPGNPMWGGRFADAPDELMTRINASVAFDQRLAEQDVRGSRAHAAMLAAQGVISAEDAAAIDQGLAAILAEIRAGDFAWSDALEDVHMNIEARLTERIGAAAGRLHTARSRNDQVATDLRLWIREALEHAVAGVRAIQTALIVQAERHADAVMPGFTHLQVAQPVTFGHHCLAYVEMLHRDAGRLADARDRMNECPLGAAALAGTPYPIDRDATAGALGFAQPMRNSLDAVSSRDFALEAMGAAAILAATLSRLAEEIVFWSSPLVGFAALSDRFSTGSSIMPQKRNPDAAELVRGKAGRIAGAFQSLLMTVKALPLAYAKDLQEDKEPVFDVFDQLQTMLPAMAGMVADLTMDRARMASAAGSGHATATDLADWLVREAGLPFREAHHVTGRVVAEADRLGVALWNMPKTALAAIDPRLPERLDDVCSVEASVRSRTSAGGTAPVRVREQAAAWRARLEDKSQ